MNSNHRAWTVLVSIMTILVLASTAFSGGVKNKGTFTNASGSTLNVSSFQNYNGAVGILANQGIINVSTLLDNRFNGSTINNTGTINVTGATGVLNNNLSGAVINNSGSGLIDVQGGTSDYTNGAGTTSNTSLTNGIRVANTMTLAGTSFDTQNGKVSYEGAGGSIYSLVAGTTPTYGALVVNTTGTRTMDGAISSGDITISGGTMSIGNFKLTATGTGGIQGAGTFVANAGANSEVDYHANAAQPIKSTTYTKLTLSGATAAQTKTASGAITVSGALNNDANTTFALADNFTYTGTAANFTNAGSFDIKGDASVTDTSVSAGVVTYSGATTDGNGDQSIAAVQYSNLSLSGTGTKTFLPKTVQVSGNYNVAVATGARTYPAGSVFRFNGVTQTVAGESYGKLEIFSTTSATLAANASATNAAGLDALLINSGATFIVPSGMTMTVNTGDLSNDGTLTNNGTVTVN